MFREKIIGLIIIILILMGGVVWWVVGRQAQVAPPKLEIKKSSSEQIAKLVYVGTNETLSEALYNLDLQDGKLDRPHIVHKIMEQGPRAEITKRSLQFIGLNGETKKEIIFESKTSKMDIVTIHNGKYAKVMYDYGTMGDFWSVDYYDIEGKLIFRKRQTDYWDELLADGKTLLRYQIYMEKLLDNHIYLVDLKENILAKIKVGDAKWIGLVGIDRGIGDKFLLFRCYLSKRDAERWILADAKGKVHFVKNENSYETSRGIIAMNKLDITIFIQTDPPRGKITGGNVIVLNSKGGEIDKIKGYSGAVVSSDQKWVALISDDDQQILLVSAVNPKEKTKILGDSLLKGRLAEVEMLNRDIIAAKTIEKDEHIIYSIFKGIESRKIYIAPLEHHSGMLLQNKKLIIYNRNKYTADTFEEVSPYIYIYEIESREKT